MKNCMKKIILYNLLFLIFTASEFLIHYVLLYVQQMEQKDLFYGIILSNFWVIPFSVLFFSYPLIVIKLNEKIFLKNILTQREKNISLILIALFGVVIFLIDKKCDIVNKVCDNYFYVDYSFTTNFYMCSILRVRILLTSLIAFCCCGSRDSGRQRETGDGWKPLKQSESDRGRFSLTGDGSLSENEG
ncbi:MAG: hypothetical protein E7614_01945 [Ruminococcaceae bacterium]|nr:hypothetical protein [Oscillospiraceae bacterium]